MPYTYIYTLTVTWKLTRRVYSISYINIYKSDSLEFDYKGSKHYSTFIELNTHTLELIKNYYHLIEDLSKRNDRKKIHHIF